RSRTAVALVVEPPGRLPFSFSGTGYYGDHDRAQHCRAADADAGNRAQIGPAGFAAGARDSRQGQSAQTRAVAAAGTGAAERNAEAAARGREKAGTTSRETGEAGYRAAE